MQIKSMRFYYISVRMVKRKIVTILNVFEVAEKLDQAYTASRNVQWHSHSGKQFDNFI